MNNDVLIIRRFRLQFNGAQPQFLTTLKLYVRLPRSHNVSINKRRMDMFVQQTI